MHVPTSQVEDGAPFLSLHVVTKCYASWCNLYKLVQVTPACITLSDNMHYYVYTVCLWGGVCGGRGVCGEGGGWGGVWGKVCVGGCMCKQLTIMDSKS